MAVETRLFLSGDSALAGLKAAATAAGLIPTQLEHEIDWVVDNQHGDQTTGGVLGLYEGDRLAGYVPLRYYCQGLGVRFAGAQLGRIPYRTVQLFGPAIVASDPALVPAALAGLARLPWPYHALQFIDVPIESPIWRAVEGGAAPGFVTVERGRQDNYVVDLPRTVEEYQTRFSSKTRGTLRRKARKLEEVTGELTMKVYTGPEHIPELLQAVEAVLLKTYHYHLLGVDLTSKNRIWVETLALFAARGWLRGYVLFGAGKPIAYVIGFTACRRFSYEYPAYDPDLSAHSPGLVLLLRMLEDMIGRGDTDLVDFGGGFAEYKKLFSTRSFLGASALLVRRDLYARGAVTLERSVVAASAAAARVLERYQVKSKVKNWLRQLKLRG